MLVNKTVEFFLSEAAGWSGMPAGAEAWAGTRCRRENHRVGSGLGAARDWNKMPAGAEAGAETRCRRPNHMGR